MKVILENNLIKSILLQINFSGILMVASDNIFEEKQYVEKFSSPKKNLSKRLFIPFLKYQVMKIT